jgi:hypothetical protein
VAAVTSARARRDGLLGPAAALAATLLCPGLSPAQAPLPEAGNPRVTLSLACAGRPNAVKVTVANTGGRTTGVTLGSAVAGRNRWVEAYSPLAFQFADSRGVLRFWAGTSVRPLAAPSPVVVSPALGAEVLGWAAWVPVRPDSGGIDLKPDPQRDPTGTLFMLSGGGGAESNALHVADCGRSAFSQQHPVVPATRTTP